MDAKNETNVILNNAAALAIQTGLDQQHLQQRLAAQVKLRDIRIQAQKQLERDAAYETALAHVAQFSRDFESMVSQSLGAAAAQMDPATLADAIPEEIMCQFEERIPEIAESAFTIARYEARASGLPLLEVINNDLVETAPDGSQRFIKSLPPPYKVVKGSKWIRRAS